MPPRKAPKPTLTPAEELAQLEALMSEQVEGAVARARKDSGRMSASYMAKGDSLVLLICRADGSKPARRLFLCNIVDVKDS